MPQSSQTIANGTGSTVRSAMNTVHAALFSNNSGTSAPTDTVAHMFWADTTNGILWRRNAANTGWINFATLDETFVLTRSSNTMLDASDKGKYINCTAGFTQTLDTPANLKDGWWAVIRNNSSSTMTITPSSGTIDGASSRTIPTGLDLIVFCNGSNFFSHGTANLLANNNIWAAAQRGTIATLTSSTSITPDFNAGNNFSLTLAHNTTLNTPSNLAYGQSGVIEISQDGTGSRTMAFSADWLFSGGTDPVLSTAANAKDLLCYQTNAAGTKIYANLLKGMA